MKRYSVNLLLICLLILFSSCKSQGTQPGNQPPDVSKNPDIPAVDKMILDPAAWKDKYPLVYESFLKTSMQEGKVSENYCI